MSALQTLACMYAQRIDAFMMLDDVSVFSSKIIFHYVYQKGSEYLEHHMMKDTVKQILSSKTFCISIQISVKSIRIVRLTVSQHLFS